MNEIRCSIWSQMFLLHYYLNNYWATWVETWAWQEWEIVGKASFLTWSPGNRVMVFRYETGLCTGSRHHQGSCVSQAMPPASVTDANHYGQAGIWAPFYSTSPQVKCLHIEVSGLFKQLLNISKKKSNVNSDTVTSFRSRCSGST